MLKYLFYNAPFAFLILCGCLFIGCDKKDNQNQCQCNGQPYLFSAGGTVVAFPTGFTPNGDGRNDQFIGLFRNIDASTFSMRITTTKGELVYQTKDIYSGWDGRINGATAPQGRYDVLFSFSDNSGTQVETCTCMSLYEYDQQFQCLRLDRNSAVFLDQLASNGTAINKSNEFFCP